MIKLYSRDSAGSLRYHEAWIDDDQIVEHWGRVGERGQTQFHDLPAGETERAALNAVLASARADGFTEFDEIELQYLDVVYERDLFEPRAYLEVSDQLGARLDSELGWTGLGHWHGSGIWSGLLRLVCVVVDVEIAERIIRTTLPDSPRFIIEPTLAAARTPPERIRIAYEDYSSRTNAIGSYAHGQFLALIHGTRRNAPEMIAVALFRFDHLGALVHADVRSDVPLADADSVREQLIRGLADVVYGDIAIRTFVVEVDGVTWCLVDETEEHGNPRVGLYPLDILFAPPWDGTYDT